MPHGLFNKYRAALEVLQRGRDTLVEDLADEIVDQADDYRTDYYAFNELLETQGTRLHFLGLLMSHLEQSAEAFDEAQVPPPIPRPPVRRRRVPAKKVQQQTSNERSPEDV